ncbi:hypothetical protein Tco_1365561 [Tanacetum coccineum]
MLQHLTSHFTYQYVTFSSSYEQQAGNNNVDLHDHEITLLSTFFQQHEDNVKLDTHVLADEDDEGIFDGDDDTLDDTFNDVLSMSNIKRKKRNQVSVFRRNKMYCLIDEDDEEEDDIFG